MYGIFPHEGCSVEYTPTSADVAAGDVIVQNSLIGIAKEPISQNVKGALAVEGVFSLVKASGDGGIGTGDDVYWDDSDHVVTTSDDGTTYLGVCVADAADTDVLVSVRLKQ